MMVVPCRGVIGGTAPLYYAVKAYNPGKPYDKMARYDGF